MLLSIFAVVGGLTLLIYGADRLVYGAVGVAGVLGFSPLIIGLIVIGFGTSAPEILVSATAALQGNPGIGFGNAIGSNITNIIMVLGVTALIIPLQISSQALKYEFPLLILISFLTFMLVIDGEISQFDSAILLLGIFMTLGLLGYFTIRNKKDGADDTIATKFNDEISDNARIRKGCFWLIIGLTLLIGSSKALVWGAVNIAQAYGISDLIIGLTIIAIGTSLPELAASIMSAIRKEHDLIIGNIIGSNIFNLLAVIGITGAIQPGAFPDEALTRDMPIMLVLTVALFLMACPWRGAVRITRLQGSLLFTGFVAYEYMLYTAAMRV